MNVGKDSGKEGKGRGGKGRNDSESVRRKEHDEEEGGVFEERGIPEGQERRILQGETLSPPIHRRVDTHARNV